MSVENGLVEPLDDAIGLRALCLGAGMVDVLDPQIEFVLVTLVVAAIFRTAVGQDAAERNVMIGMTRSLRRSAAVIGVLRSYSLANPTFE